MAKKSQQPVERPGTLFGGAQQPDIFHNSPLSMSTLQPKKKSKFRVLSPDGFDIMYDTTWTTKEAAEEACKQWAQSFSAQGYYSTTRNGYVERIPVNEIPTHCTIKQVR